ncbi:4-hydroxyphenylacetate 3-hydroxylase [Herbiconiux moechotypicola]|uniref:4-hydroxyphenylacetate 3-hydroxylase N-terminal domain-containing protein n=1 Tax=Herbiconiux moechotypicola TaxID=637393 RepID=A0ABP5QJL3_9MICO|nr:4-hydroxyphenylacetate 3-hydroxylase N-terminal domain-containing protein [Herbiconiux moechotypicola]MCS5730084.1 4-hydroxyphenylacetate 3-hydroxylase [Herbiconiux moechotypicola]
MRTGRQYIEALDDGRDVRVDGERVQNVATHPAFAGIVASVAGIYDHANTAGSRMLDPETGRHLIYSIPRTTAESDARRAALEEWSELANGFIGRGPDHVAGLLAGFVSNAALFDEPADPVTGAPGAQRSRTVLDYYEYAASRGLWITNSIVPPQSNPADPTSTARQLEVVGETAEGVIVSGAQMLASGGAVADEIFVTCVRPLREGEEDRALSFIIPVNAPGLRMISRRPYAQSGSVFDYPLSTRFDESDSMVTFDDVLVPWDRLFILRDRAKLQQQFFATAAHQLGNIQSVIRLAAKLRFIAGLAARVASANGRENDLAVKHMVTDVSLIATTVESFVESAYSRASVDEFGVVRPDGQFLYAALGMQTELYPNAVRILAELCGGGVIQLPASEADLADPEERASMALLMGSELVTLDERVKLFKLVWDVVGSEYAGRHVQYERFYSGAQHVVKGYAHRNYPFARADRLVDEFLSGYDRGSMTGAAAAGTAGPTETEPVDA